MIEVTLRSANKHKDILSIRCEKCDHVWVYSRSELEPSGYNTCRLCGGLLPDIEALVYNVKHRVTHHTRYSEHFMRKKCLRK